MQDFKGLLVVGQGNPSFANDKSSSLRQFYTSHQLTTGRRLASPLSNLSNQNRIKKKTWGEGAKGKSKRGMDRKRKGDRYERGKAVKVCVRPDLERISKRETQGDRHR